MCTSSFNPYGAWQGSNGKMRKPTEILRNLHDPMRFGGFWNDSDTEIKKQEKNAVNDANLASIQPPEQIDDEERLKREKAALEIDKRKKIIQTGISSSQISLLK